MTPKTRIYCIAALWALLVGGVVGVSLWRGHQIRVAQAHIVKADTLETTQASHGAQAEVHEQQAEILIPVIQSDDDAVRVAAGEVARLRKEAAARANLSQIPAIPVSSPVALAPLDAAKDRLIDAQGKEIVDLKVQNAELLAGDLARIDQVKALQSEVLELRASIAARPRDQKWSATAIYGTNQTVGGGIDYRWGIVRAGIDVVRRPIGGGQTTLEALGRVSICF